MPAILSHTRNVVFLDDREMVVVTAKGSQFMTLDGTAASRRSRRASPGIRSGGEGRLQALHAQGDLRAADAPSAKRFSAGSRWTPGSVFLDEMGVDRRRLRARSTRCTLLACGTSWHAALVGKFLIEQLAGLPTKWITAPSTAIATRSSNEQTLAVVITQSGETADTLAALREAKSQRRAQPRDLQRRRQHGHARGRGNALHARRA